MRVKREVESYPALADWYDTYYRDHRTWRTSRAYAHALLRLLRQAGLTHARRKTLLDVACGGGYFLEHSAPFFRAVQGCDISRVALREARERCGWLRLCQSNAECLPFAAGTFDVVSCLGSLEHFFQPTAALAEFRRLVKPGGWVLVLVPTNPDWAEYDIQPTEIVMGPREWERLFVQCALDPVVSVATDDHAELKAGSGGCQVYCLRPLADPSIQASKIMATTPDRAFLGGDLRPDELEQILRQIDDNLAQRPVLRDPAAGGMGAALPALGQRIGDLRRVGAPLFLTGGRGLGALARRLLNLPIRVFGRKQIYFNNTLLTLLEDLAATQQGQSDWIRLLERKLQMLALDLREQQADAPSATQANPAPRIINPAAYQRRLEAMGGQLRVNLGCGEKPWPDYINVDFRELPEVDVIAEVRNLPFDPGSLAELASAHLVEHFREHQLRTRIIPYWKSLLRPGGTLRIICPNWAAMLERLQDGRMALAEFKLITFGAQDYQGDDHFAMYTPKTLSALLTECGFTRIEVLATDRMNGLCPEMELLAHL